MAPQHKIRNAMKRSEVARKEKREKAQAKLARRMENRKAEKQKGVGEQLKKERLTKNVPRTQENTREYDQTSYLTANPATLRAAAERAAEASRRANGAPESMAEEDEDSEEDDEEGQIEVDNSEGPIAGPSTLGILPTQPPDDGETAELGPDAEEQTGEVPPNPLIPTPPPRILITTSISPCKDTYAFCEELKNLFPGGEFFRRPKGRGFEMGRICRWGAKRGFNAMLVVNEDHKKANAITLINLPAGPTAYFKLTSIQLGKTIFGHARPTPHSPELILNNFTTLLGHAVGRLFGSLFPPMPQFRGRQVVTLHNQRDFLFFRRHRYAFSSATSAKLQEIGPRFTLRLRWLRNGLPAVTAGDGRVPHAADHAASDAIHGVDEDEGDGNGDDDEDEQMDEEAAMRDIGKPQKVKPISDEELGIPALDDQQEYEWKWKPKMDKSRRMFYL